MELFGLVLSCHQRAVGYLLFNFTRSGISTLTKPNSGLELRLMWEEGPGDL